MYNTSLLIDNKCYNTLRDAFIILCIQMHPLDGPSAIVRTHAAHGFKALEGDATLQSHSITLKLGQVKNNNKNPVAEKAVQELKQELLWQDPQGGPVSHLALSLTIATLNSCICMCGLSAREMWTQRDQFSNSQIPLSNQELITQQHQLHRQNHSQSEKSKAPIAKQGVSRSICVGDLVYLHSDRSKSCARDRYLFISVNGSWFDLRTFVCSQLCNTSYKVNASECYKVPADSSPFLQCTPQTSRFDPSNDEDEEDENIHLKLPPKPPEIPTTISMPPSSENSSSSNAPIASLAL